MFRFRRQTALLLAPFALMSITGCGAGSGNSVASSTGGRAALDIYVTDGITDNYKQVLATLYKIELTTDGTNYTTVYSSTAGQTLDLASLASTALLLSSVTVPTGTYTAARVTFGDHITLVTNSGVSSSVAVNASLGTDVNGQISIVVNTPNKVQANQTNSVFVDFNLAAFKLVGNVLEPSINCMGNTSAQQSKQHAAYIPGTVANLTTTGFTLQSPNGRTTTVAISSTTTITDGQTGQAITLTNGESVLVQGTYDPTTSTITATAVVLNDASMTEQPRVGGTVASINTTAGSFILTVQHADGVQPTGGTITVVTNSSTVFMVGQGQTGSLASLTTSANVVAEGTFDAATQTLTATSVGLLPAGGMFGGDPHGGPNGGPGGH